MGNKFENSQRKHSLPHFPHIFWHFPTLQNYFGNTAVDSVDSTYIYILYIYTSIQPTLYYFVSVFLWFFADQNALFHNHFARFVSVSHVFRFRFWTTKLTCDGNRWQRTFRTQKVFLFESRVLYKAVSENRVPRAGFLARAKGRSTSKTREGNEVFHVRRGKEHRFSRLDAVPYVSENQKFPREPENSRSSVLNRLRTMVPNRSSSWEPVIFLEIFWVPCKLY